MDEVSKDRIIEMAWEDRTPFDAIKLQFGLKEQDVMVSTSSHDIGSKSLFLFNLFLHRLQEDYPEIRNDPGMHELLDRIPGSFTKMLTFIDTLLNYAMAGKIIGDMQSVSLGKIVQTVIEQFEQEQQQGIVKFKLPSKWPKVQILPKLEP